MRKKYRESVSILGSFSIRPPIFQVSKAQEERRFRDHNLKPFWMTAGTWAVAPAPAAAPAPALAGRGGHRQQSPSALTRTDRTINPRRFMFIEFPSDQR